MQKVYSKGVNGWGQLALILGFVGFGAIIGGIVGAGVWKVMTHGSLLNMEKDILNPANYLAVQVVQAIAVLFMFLVPTIAFAFLCYKNGWDYLGFTGKIKPVHLLIVLLLVFCSLPLIGLLEELNKWVPLTPALRARFNNLEKDYNDQVQAMAQVKSWTQYASSLLIIAALPAFTEEMLFRGVLQNMLVRWTKMPWVSIIIASFLFSAFHMSWYGFLPRFALGVVLGSVFMYSGSILPNILLHFINNALVITSMFVSSRSGAAADINSGDSFPLWTGIIALFLVILLIWWLIKSADPLSFEEEKAFISTKNPFEDSQTHF